MFNFTLIAELLAVATGWGFFFGLAVATAPEVHSTDHRVVMNLVCFVLAPIMASAFLTIAACRVFTGESKHLRRLAKLQREQEVFELQCASAKDVDDRLAQISTELEE